MNLTMKIKTTKPSGAFYLKLGILTILSISTTISFAQNNGNAGQGVTQWKTNGNIADSNHFIGTKNDFPVKFRTNDFERLRITSEGNIGIGTFNPQAKLDVNGNVILRNSLQLTSIPISNGIPNFLMTIDGNGYVTKATSQALAQIIYEPQFCAEGNGPYVNPVWSNSLNTIYNACPINVGIGTATPGYSLDVRGAGYFQDGLKVGASVNNNMPALIEGYHSQNNQRPWLRFTNMSSGTNETVFLVEKNGGLYCTSVRVRLSQDIPVPDYVFKKDYNLMSLDNLNEYIKEHSHLPNIPSEDEIREKGVSIEEMQMKLLEKVEELTLYILQLQQENKELRELISDKD